MPPKKIKKPSAKKKPAAKKKKIVPVLIRTSEFTTYEACKWQWDRAFNDKMKPIREKPALRFGSLIHEALELRYPVGTKRGPHPAETFERLFEEEEESIEGFYDAEGEWADACELGIDMLNGYVDEYGEDEEWEVIASEMTFQVPVYDPLTGELLFYYVGTMDGVWKHRRTKRTRVNDYKTTSGDPVKEAQAKYALDPQSTSYWTWGCDFLIQEGILPAREVEEMDGMLYTFLKKAKKDLRPQNAEGLYLNQPTKPILLEQYKNLGKTPPKKGEGSGKDGNVVVADLLADLGPEAVLLGEVSDRQPGPRFHRETVYRSQAERENARHRAIQQFKEMARVRSGEAEAYKSPGTGFPHEQCKACGYRDLCELHESGDDWKSVAAATMGTWEPNSAHEIKEEGKSR